MAWTRKKNKYSRPRKIYNKARISEENELLKKYGLKNKKEIWKADAAIGRIRKRAKKLITTGREEQQVLLNRLNKMGFKVKTTGDILGLNKENWLKRRLQSVIIEKNRLKPREARQLISHKQVSISGKIINIPSYIVKVNEEDNIEVIRKNKIKEKLKDKKEEGVENG